MFLMEMGPMLVRGVEKGAWHLAALESSRDGRHALDLLSMQEGGGGGAIYYIY